MKRIKDTTATSYTDSAVSVNQTKTYTMRCIDKNGNTVSGYNSKGWSKKYTPVAPTISKLENTSGGIKLSWNKIAGVYGYRLYYKTSSGGWKRFKDTTATSFTDSGVSPNRTETYTIRRRQSRRTAPTLQAVRPIRRQHGDKSGCCRFAG